MYSSVRATGPSPPCWARRPCVLTRGSGTGSPLSPAPGPGESQCWPAGPTKGQEGRKAPHLGCWVWWRSLVETAGEPMGRSSLPRTLKSEGQWQGRVRRCVRVWGGCLVVARTGMTGRRGDWPQACWAQLPASSSGWKVRGTLEDVLRGLGPPTWPWDEYLLLSVGKDGSAEVRVRLPGDQQEGQLRALSDPQRDQGGRLRTRARGDLHGVYGVSSCQAGQAYGVALLWGFTF